MNIFRNLLCSLGLVTSILGSSVASSATEPENPEEVLLKIIDEEVFKMAPETMEWTEGYGVQPKDAYEMDYSEKCFFIQHTHNLQARKACELIVNESEPK